MWLSALFETLCDWLEDWIVAGGGERGNADALMWNRPEASRAVKDHPGLKVVDFYPPIFVGELAFAIPKGNEALLSKLEATLAKLISKIVAHRVV